jgi:hypothetical protein
MHFKLSRCFPINGDLVLYLPQIEVMYCGFDVS